MECAPSFAPIMPRARNINKGPQQHVQETS